MRTVRYLLATLFLLFMQAGGRASPPHSLIRLATFDYPPFMETVNGHASGIMLDVVTEAFRRMGIPVEISFYPLARGFLLVSMGEVDGMFTLKQTPERIGTYAFSREPLLTQEYVVFVARDSKLTFSGRLSELSSQRIGMVAGTSYGSVFDTAMRDGTFKLLDAALNHESNFKKLLARHIDVIVQSKSVGLSILKRLNATDQVKIIGPPVETTLSYIMFGKEVDPETVRAFDKAIASMRADGTINRIYDQYTR